MPNPYINTVPQAQDLFTVEGQSETAYDIGLQMFTLDNPYSASSTKTCTSGVGFYMPVRANGEGPISGFATYITTAGGTLTAGDNLVGLYSVSTTGILTLIALSVDFTTAWGSTGQQTGGLQALYSVSTVNSVNQIILVENALYYIGILSVGTTGVTMAATPACPASLMQGKAGVVTSNVAQPPFMSPFSSGSALTALPTSLNLGTATVTALTQAIAIGAY